MINLITAIGNQYLNDKIKNFEDFNVILKDIQYPDGILEILNINDNINILLLSTEIFVDNEIKIFIENIKEKYKKLEIIIFIEDKYKIDYAFFNSNEIYKIYKNNILGYNEYLNCLNNSKININEQIKENTKSLKEQIIEKKELKLENKFSNYREIENNKIIMISGTNGIGKSFFTSIFSKYIESIKRNVLILDTCLENSSINTIFGKKIENKIQKISEKIYYLNYKILNPENDYINLKNNIEEIKEKFDYILIDTNNENVKLNKCISSFSEIIIFLIEPNLIEIKKAKRILEIYKYDFEVSTNKTKIIFNKTNKFQISSEILKEVFEEYEILEYIKYNSKYTLYINRNMKYIEPENIFQKIYIKIIN